MQLEDLDRPTPWIGRAQQFDRAPTSQQERALWAAFNRPAFTGPRFAADSGETVHCVRNRSSFIDATAGLLQSADCSFECVEFDRGFTCVHQAIENGRQLRLRHDERPRKTPFVTASTDDRHVG